MINVSHNELPPPDRTDYEYLPRPAFTMPPTGSQVFVHWLYNPSCSDDETPEVLGLLPKLMNNNVGDGTEAWGIELIDDGDVLSIIAKRLVTRFLFCICIFTSFCVPLLVCSLVIRLYRSHSSSRQFPFSLWKPTTWSYSTLFSALCASFAIIAPFLYAFFHRAVQGSRSHTYRTSSQRANLSMSELRNVQVVSSKQQSRYLQAALRLVIPSFRHIFALWHNLCDSLLTIFMRVIFHSRSKAKLVKTRCVSTIPRSESNVTTRTWEPQSCGRKIYLHAGSLFSVDKIGTAMNWTDQENNFAEEIELESTAGQMEETSSHTQGSVPLPLGDNIRNRRMGNQEDEEEDQNPSEGIAEYPDHVPPPDEYDEWIHLIFKTATTGSLKQVAINIKGLHNNQSGFKPLGITFSKHWGSWHARRSIKNIRLTKVRTWCYVFQFC